jgi:hypothetical protein
MMPVPSNTSTASSPKPSSSSEPLAQPKSKSSLAELLKSPAALFLLMMAMIISLREPGNVLARLRKRGTQPQPETNSESTTGL